MNPARAKEKSAPTPAGGGGFRLLSDQPTGSDEDQLGYDQIASRLANVITRSRASTPLTIAIEGEWGLGKSTLMRCLCAALDKEDGVKTVWFNAWTAEGHSALEGLIKSILYELDTSLVRRAARKTRLLGAARLALIPIASWLGFTRLVDAVWDRANADAHTRNELRELVGRAVGSWVERYSTQEGRLLVVFVDDLDRAAGEQVMEVFEAIKLYLDVHGFVFVIGFDRSAVTGVVADEKYFGTPARAREYMEKIMQITYGLQPPDDRQAEVLLDHYTKLSKTEGLFGNLECSLVVERNQRNPRRIKRFLNAFVLAYDLDPEWREIGPKSLVEVLLLEIHFPEFANLFRSRPAIDPIAEFLGYLDRRDAIEASTPDDGGGNGEDLAELERSLPEDYPLLARSGDFTALVRAMQASSRWPEVRAKLERRGAASSPRADDATVEVRLESTKGGRLLWIDDDPLANERLVNLLQREGWLITQVEDGAAASQLLRQQHRYDLVVSDCVRNGRSEAGLEDMAAIRGADLYNGPVIFFTLRITPELRDRASVIGARITNRVEELLEMVRSSVPDNDSRLQWS